MKKAATFGILIGLLSGVARNDRFWGRFYGRTDGRTFPYSSADAGTPTPEVLFATASSDLGTECGCNNTLTADTGQSVTFTRTGGAYCRKASDGLWVLCSNNNEPRVSAWLPGETVKGIAVERASTNDVQHNRDLTQASVWAVSGITPVKDSTGIDGSANSATRITSAGASSAIWQTVTASGNRSTSFWAKLVTGSPAAADIRVTREGGSGWINMGSSITSSWKRFQPQPCGDDTACVQIAGLNSTYTNPVIGWEVNSASIEIAIDMVQDEALPWASSPIVTAGASATRNVERARITLTGWNESAFSSYGTVMTWATSAIGSSYLYSFIAADNELCDFRTYGTSGEVANQCDFGASSMSKTTGATATPTNKFNSYSSKYDGTTLTVCTGASCATSTTGSQSGIDPTTLDIGATALFAGTRAQGVVRNLCLDKNATRCAP